MGDPAMIDRLKEPPLSLQPSELNHFAGSPQGRIMNAVRQMLAEREITVAVSPEDNLFQVGLNSLDMLNLVLSLEAEFDITIPETEITIANLRTISTLGSLIDRLMNPTAAIYAK
jgi:acyl carrier protein